MVQKVSNLAKSCRLSVLEQYWPPSDGNIPSEVQYDSLLSSKLTWQWNITIFLEEIHLQMVRFSFVILVFGEGWLFYENC